MKKLLAFLIVFLNLVAAAELTGAAQYGGVEFPDGAISFADRVISYNPGPDVVSPNNNPSAALGIPDYESDQDGSYVSLGDEGVLIVKFTDNSLTGSGDSEADLWIFEIGAAIEPTSIAISKDGTNWIEVGATSGATSGIDIDQYVPYEGVIGERYSYVRITDLLPHQSGYPYAGADIDAVGAISSGLPIPGSSLWEPLYEKALREGCQATDLEVLRAFRDEVLVKSPAGKKYVDRLYKYSFESALILLTNPDISNRVEDILQWLTPEIQNRIEDGEMVLYQEDIEEFEILLDAFAEEASPQLRAFVWKVKMDLRNEKFLKRLGIFVDD